CHEYDARIALGRRRQGARRGLGPAGPAGGGEHRPLLLGLPRRGGGVPGRPPAELRLLGDRPRRSPDRGPDPGAAGGGVGRPGGVLVTADVVPLQPGRGRLLKALAAAAWLFPASNDYDAAGYVARLARTGFRAVEVQSIRAKVYLPYVRWTLSSENRPRLRR